MAIGYPASSRWSQSFNIDPVILRQLVRDAIEHLGWSYETPEPHISVAKIPANANSWGELVTVVVAEDGEVEAVSKCVWPGQLFDWGKNRANLNQFHASLLKAIRNSALDPKTAPEPFDKTGKSPLERALSKDDQKTI